MAEWNSGVKSFLAHWFSGLMDGLASADASTRSAILRACGRACAESYTAEVFVRARKSSDGIEAFLAALDASFSEASYELLDSRVVRVRYSSCACDLVHHGLVQSPLICECSASNLQENFERALGTPVTVKLEATILGGAPQCVLLATLGGVLR